MELIPVNVCALPTHSVRRCCQHTALLHLRANSQRGLGAALGPSPLSPGRSFPDGPQGAQSTGHEFTPIQGGPAAPPPAPAKLAHVCDVSEGPETSRRRGRLASALGPTKFCFRGKLQRPGREYPAHYSGRDGWCAPTPVALTRCVTAGGCHHPCHGSRSLHTEAGTEAVPLHLAHGLPMEGGPV